MVEPIVSEEILHKSKAYQYFWEELHSEIQQFTDTDIQEPQEAINFSLCGDIDPNNGRDDECEMKLFCMESSYNSDDDKLPYWRNLKKRLPKFKKEVFKNLSKEDIDMIYLLSNFKMKVINQSIKNNIEDHKKILA